MSGSGRMLHLCDVGIITVPELGSRFSDFVAFMSFEDVKQEQHGRYKEDMLHFNKSVETRG